MIDKKEVEQIAQEFLSHKDENYYLVDVLVRPGNVIVVEFDNMESGVDIDTCAEMSRFIESKLDREIEDYELEVGSPLLTAPLKHPKQYQKFLNQEVEVLTKKGMKETGILVAFDGDTITLRTTKMIRKEGDKRKKPYEEEYTYPLTDLKWTKCVVKFK